VTVHKWNRDSDDVRDQRSAKPTNHYTRKAQEDNFQLPACLLVRAHWPLRTSVDWWGSSNPARCTYFLIAGRVLDDNPKFEENLLIFAGIN